MAKDIEERLQKIITQIAKENLVIAQTKQRLKLLKEQKKKLEKQIQEEESARLMSVLADFGIKTSARWCDTRDHRRHESASLRIHQRESRTLW